MTTENARATGLPGGWLAAALGGFVGTFVGGCLGYMSGIFYADTYQSDGLDGLFTMFLLALLGGVVGAAIGVFLSLKVKSYERPGVSAFVFTVVAVLILVGFGFLAQMRLAQELDALVALGACTITPMVSGIAARLVAGFRS